MFLLAKADVLFNGCNVTIRCDIDHGKRGACGMRILIRGDEERSVEAEGVVEGVRGLRKEKEVPGGGG